jgi:hypothetical protein
VAGRLIASTWFRAMDWHALDRLVASLLQPRLITVIRWDRLTFIITHKITSAAIIE